MNLQENIPDLTRLSQSISRESFDPLLKKDIAGECQQMSYASSGRIAPLLYIKVKSSTIFEIERYGDQVSRKWQ